MAASATSLSTFSSLSLHHHAHPSPRHQFSLHYHSTTSLSPQTPKLFTSSSSLSLKPTITHCTPADTIFFEAELPEPNTFNPPDLPEDSSSSQTDDVPVLTETEEEIAAAYEELYGPAYSGISVLGNDINVMDKKFQKTGAFGKIRKEKVRDGFDERVVQVRRVTKVVKGGKQMHFRAIVVVGDKKGKVGVGVGKAKEVIGAVQKGATDARRNVISIPLTKYMTFPHRSDGKYGAASVMLRPASPGTGVIAGGSVRIVLELAGVENALGKQLGSNNALNNARATIVAVLKMRQFSEVAEERGIPMEELWK